MYNKLQRSSDLLDFPTASWDNYCVYWALSPRSTHRSWYFCLYSVTVLAPLTKQYSIFSSRLLQNSSQQTEFSVLHEPEFSAVLLVSSTSSDPCTCWLVKVPCLICTPLHGTTGKNLHFDHIVWPLTGSFMFCRSLITTAFKGSLSYCCSFCISSTPIFFSFVLNSFS